jgi:hypothetical protein
MKIKNVIYSEHLIWLAPDSIPDIETRQAAVNLGYMQEEIIKSRYPNAEIETVVIHNVSGVGSGIQVHGEDIDDEDIAARITDILTHHNSELIDLIWGDA